MDILQPGIDLKQYRPHPTLLAMARQYTSRRTLAALPFFARADELSRAEVSAALAQAKKTAPRDLVTLVIGASSFHDVPLETLLQKGAVIGIDADPVEMKQRAAGLPRQLRGQLNLLHMDASLYASHLLSLFVGSSYAEALEATVNAAKQLIQSKYPFLDSSVALIVARNCFHVFFMDPAGNIFQRVMASGPARTEEALVAQGAFLQAQRMLYLISLTRYFQEMARVLTPGGVAHVTLPHFEFKAYDLSDDGKMALARTSARDRVHPVIGFSKPVVSFIGYEGLPAVDDYFRRGISIELGTRETRWTLEGPGTLKYQAAKAGLELVDHGLFWAPLAQSSRTIGDVHLSEKVVIRKAA